MFGEQALVQRCQRHKERNPSDLPPDREADRVRARLHVGWVLTDPVEALAQLQTLAGKLERSRPDAAASLREGMDETLTLMRLRIGGKLAKTFASTNPICSRPSGSSVGSSATATSPGS